MNNDLISELYKEVTTAILHPGYRQEDLYIIISKKIKAFEDELVEELTQMVQLWETEVPDDSTLYSLGLRRAIDVIQGNSPL